MNEHDERCFTKQNNDTQLLRDLLKYVDNILWDTLEATNPKLYHQLRLRMIEFEEENNNTTNYRSNG